MASEHPLALEKEQLQQLLSNNTKTAISNSFLAMLLAYVLWDAVSPLLLTVWIGMLLSVNVIRFLIGQYYLGHPTQDYTQVSARLSYFRIGVSVSAIIWGMSNFLVFGHAVDKYALIVAYMLAGISAGAAVTYSIDLASSLAFTYLSIVPMVVIFFASGNAMLVAMGVAGVAYLLFITVSMKTFNAKLLEGIQLRWEAVESAKAIEQLAFYDELTGLPNRRLLMERMEVALQNARRTRQQVGLLFLDLNEFKALNDTYGHDMGDALLKQFAARLTAAVRKSDTVARLGGDEFVVMLENINQQPMNAEETVMMVADIVQQQLSQQYQLTASLYYRCTPSIGAAISSQTGSTTADTLMKHADAAMYTAKKAGQAQVAVYDKSDVRQAKADGQRTDAHKIQG